MVNQPPRHRRYHGDYSIRFLDALGTALRTADSDARKALAKVIDSEVAGDAAFSNEPANNRLLNVILGACDPSGKFKPLA